MSLLQTIDNEQCVELRGSLCIRIVDQDDAGNRTNASDTRYVKVADSHGFSNIHAITMLDGEGQLQLDDITACQLVVAQVDEDEKQIIDGDHYAITYYVNQSECEEDYAKLYLTNDRSDQEVTIVNRFLGETTLTLTKFFLNEYREYMDAEACNIAVFVEGMGCKHCIDLNMANDFSCTLHLRPGRYHVWEEENNGYLTTYRFDQCEERGDAHIEVGHAAHTLDIYNVKRSKSVLTLDKYVRDMNGELMKPQDDECFQVRVIGDFFDKTFTLDCENDFALDVVDLPSGFYDVCEVNRGMYEVTYLVNSEKESQYAHVELCECKSASVLIINNLPMCNAQNSPLRICKYVRRSDECLVKPDPCQSFKVMLSGCGVCEIFNLNASNNFCVDIEHICCGEYEVRELDHEEFVCSYIVNDDCESTRACICIHEGGCNCVKIINEERNKGQVSICKVIRDASGDFVKPDKQARFLVTLRSFFCRETFVLDASNDFSIYLEGLKEGSYEVKEHRLDGFETSYLVNGCKESRHARFIIENGCSNEIKIINALKRERNGDLRICKYIANAYGDYVKPAADEQFDVHVSGPCVDTCYTLRASNNWCVILEGLKKGVYRIEEEETCGYTSNYMVNGCEMQDALVCMDERSQEVEIINTRRNFGNLKIATTIETCDGRSVKPNSSEHFDILIESSCDSRVVTLDACNNFCVLLEDMDQGKLRITQKDNYGYKVIYDVNGERSHNGVVTMQGQNESILIINQMMNCSGMIRVRKWIETCDGRKVRPCEDDTFDFTLCSRCLDNTYTLSKRNDFCVFFDDLEEGEYTIQEVCGDEFDVKYRINGEYVEQANFVLGREDIEVDILNKEIPEPRLCVQKRIRIDGKLVKPCEDEYFEFLLKGRNTHEVYNLNCENDWCVCIEGLTNQHYEVKEIGEDCKTQYEIDETLCEEAYFLFAKQDVEITIINEDRIDSVVLIRKFVEDEDGCLNVPCSDENFEISIEGDCYKQCFTLHSGNDFCLQIEGLACGTYRISEKDCAYDMEVRVNDCEAKDGCFNIDEEDVHITLINREACHNELSIYAYEVVEGQRVTPEKDCYYYVELEMQGQCDRIRLDCENDWCVRLCDICMGTYQLRSDESNMMLEIEGKKFVQCVEFDMDCNTVCVNLLDERCEKNDIIITKRMRDQKGNLHRPQRGASYEVRLRGSSCDECFQLRERNDWCVRLSDYPMGIYEVKEIGGDCETQYQIDGGDIVSQGYFTLEQAPVHICVINPGMFSKIGNLTVHAMIKNCDGDLEVPPIDAAFDVMIDGDDVREDATLKERNGFQRVYTQLPNGMYTITQKPNDAYTRVTYRVNGVEQPSGEIQLEDEDIQVDMLNYANCEHGSIRVMKYKKDVHCGCLKRPCMEEEYTIELHGQNMNQKVILNASNKWSYHFNHLRDGEYEIREIDSDDLVTYIVNGGKEEEQARIHIQGNDANVKVINAPMHVDPKGNIEICKLMRDENGKYHYPNKEDSYWVSVIGGGTTQRLLLHGANHFFVEVRNLQAGTYEIIEEDGQDVMYTVNGGSEEAQAIVQVDGDTHAVNVINGMQVYGSIKISKYMQDENGTLQRPLKDDTYRIHVSRPGFNKIVVLNDENDFAATLSNLPQGMYVVDELDHENVSYIIDGGTQVDRAIVDVKMRMHEVKVLNPTQRGKGSITMNKFVRSANGQMMRPSGDATYAFHVSKPGYNKNFVLNQSNDFHITLSNLEDGNYVITEETMDEHVSYIINNGSESDYGIVNVMGNANQVQIINTPKVGTRGSIRIEKYIRTDAGLLVRPTGNARYSVHISKPGYNEVFTLIEGNNWTLQLNDLEDGDYVVEEDSREERVTYIVNNGSETNYAIVNVQGNANQVKIINAPDQLQGSITLEKFIRSTNGEYTRPSGNMTFTFRVSKPGYNEIFRLDESNQWTLKITSLENGNYVINEENNDEAVTYVINNGNETNYGIVEVNDNANQVWAINASGTGNGSILLEKYVRSENGSFVRPTGNAVYTFRVTKPGFSKSVEVSQRTGWNATLANLEDGNYVFTERDNDEKVTYIVNNGSQVNYGIVEVRNNANQIKAINESSIHHMGSIVMEKYIRNENGQLVRPSGNMMFSFNVSKPGYQENFDLNVGNQWKLTLSNLEDGNYVLTEVNQEDKVSYIINDGSETDFGIINVMGNINQVKIINASSTARNGSIAITKFIRNRDGELVKPLGDFQARVHLSKPGYNEFFTLTQANDWSISIIDLMDGQYVLDEVETNDEVSWRINDGNEVRYAVVDVMHNDNFVEMINTPTMQSGAIIINKFVRNANGQLTRPPLSETFDIVVTGPSNHNITLNYDNRWSTRLDDLQDGVYQVEEVGQSNYTVSYLVNNGVESDTATINLQGSEQIVSVINSAQTISNQLEITKYIKNSDGTLMPPANGDTFQIEVRGTNDQEVFTLQPSNQYQVVLSNLQQGMVHIQEVPKEGYVTTYRINGGQETSDATIRIADGKNNVVEVINELRVNQNTLDVYKYIMDEQGNLLKPMQNQVFRFLLTGSNVYQFYTLSSANDWHMHIASLSSGDYEIIEQSNAQYSVKYSVNGGMLSELGEFSAIGGTSNVVEIINTSMSGNDGRLTLEKKIRTSAGDLMIPGNQESFQIRIMSNKGYDEIFTLDQLNGYFLQIENLAFATYQVMEIDVSDYRVSYIVNDGNEETMANIDIQSNIEQNVMIINTQAMMTFKAVKSSDIRFVIE